jgi:hypothetical protein
MCGIQIGADELRNILANRVVDSSGTELETACGIQVGAEEVSRVLTNRTGTQLADGDCVIQIGAPTNALASKTATPQR